MVANVQGPNFRENLHREATNMTLTLQEIEEMEQQYKETKISAVIGTVMSAPFNKLLSAAKDGIRMRETLDRIKSESMTMRKSEKLQGPAEYQRDPHAMRVWRRANYTNGRKIMSIVKPALAKARGETP